VQDLARPLRRRPGGDQARPRGQETCPRLRVGDEPVQFLGGQRRRRRGKALAGLLRLTQQRADAPGAPVTTPAVPVVGEDPQRRREAPAQQQGLRRRESGELVREIQPHDRPVPVQVEPRRRQKPGPRQPREPAGADAHRLGALCSAHRAYPIPQSLREVFRRPDPLDLAPCDPPAAQLPPSQHPDVPEFDGELELTSHQAQFPSGAIRAHRLVTLRRAALPQRVVCHAGTPP
jgi:hypothetical protein